MLRLRLNRSIYGDRCYCIPHLCMLGFECPIAGEMAGFVDSSTLSFDLALLWVRAQRGGTVERTSETPTEVAVCT
jgi:hypothetical protein